MNTEIGLTGIGLCGWSRRIGISLLLVLSLIGCGKKTAFSPRAAPNDPSTGWTLSLKIDPDHPRMVRPSAFLLHIADTAGKPVAAAQVKGTLNMTLMDMGKTQVNFELKGTGDYQATIKGFDMSGPWEIAIEAAKGEIRTRKSFRFTVLD
jgi:hypothetical protein